MATLGDVLVQATMFKAELDGINLLEEGWGKGEDKSLHPTEADDARHELAFRALAYMCALAGEYAPKAKG